MIYNVTRNKDIINHYVIHVHLLEGGSSCCDVMVYKEVATKRLLAVLNSLEGTQLTYYQDIYSYSTQVITFISMVSINPI